MSRDVEVKTGGAAVSSKTTPAFKVAVSEVTGRGSFGDSELGRAQTDDEESRLQ
jgi:hypothetical protein